MPPQAITRGDPGTALAEAPLRLSGEFRAGGQEHFYLEGQIAMAVPGEDGDMPSIPPPSTRPRCSTSSPGCWAATTTG